MNLTINKDNADDFMFFVKPVPTESLTLENSLHSLIVSVCRFIFYVKNGHQIDENRILEAIKRGATEKADFDHPAIKRLLVAAFNSLVAQKKEDYGSFEAKIESIQLEKFGTYYPAKMQLGFRPTRLITYKLDMTINPEKSGPKNIFINTNPLIAHLG